MTAVILGAATFAVGLVTIRTGVWVFRLAWRDFRDGHGVAGFLVAAFALVSGAILMVSPVAGWLRWER